MDAQKIGHLPTSQPSVLNVADETIAHNRHQQPSDDWNRASDVTDSSTVGTEGSQ